MQTVKTKTIPNVLGNCAYEIGILRFVNRDFIQGGVQSANVAEQSYRVAMLAWVIADRENANVGEVLKMALAHDFPEIRTLDQGIVSAQYNVTEEAKAAQDAFAPVLPDALTSWQNYEERQTLEAKIVKDADRLDVFLECRELASRGLQIPNYWLDELNQYLDMYTTETAKALHKAAATTHPGEWNKTLHLRKLNKIANGQSHKLQSSSPSVQPIQIAR